VVGKVFIARSHKISTVRRRGLRARCRPAQRGRCRVRITRGGKTVARGTSRTTARGRTRKLRLRFTKRGKRLLRRGRTFRTAALLAAPGVDTQRVRVRFRR
jgi:hypothetical protein